MKLALRLALVPALILAAVPPAAARVVAAASLSRPAQLAWGRAADGLAHALTLRADLDASAPGLLSTLGHARVELSFDDAAPEALAFVRHLPDSLSADPDGFQALPLAEQARLASEAAAGARAELVSRAASAEGAERLALASGWFYLPGDAGRALRVEAAAARGRAGASLARRLASALSSEKKEDPGAAAASQEWRHLLRGVMALERTLPAGALRGDGGRAASAYALRAFDAAAARTRERGEDPSRFAAIPYDAHRELFGAMAPRSLVESMRRDGAWTPFVASLLLRASAFIQASGSAAARASLGQAGAVRMFALPVPDWMPEAAAHATVTESIAASVPAPEVPVGLSGRRVGTLLGMPVFLTGRAPLFIAASAVFFGLTTFPALTPGLGHGAHLLQGAALAAITYGTVLAHELGHALTTKLFGGKVLGLIINSFGGGAMVDPPPGAAGYFLMTLAGPVVNFAAAALLYGAALLMPASLASVSAVLVVGSWINVLGGASNLLPLFPMDGGRMLQIALSAAFGDQYRGAVAARRAAIALAAAFVPLGGALALLGWLKLGAFAAVFGLHLGSKARSTERHPGTEPAAVR